MWCSGSKLVCKFNNLASSYPYFKVLFDGQSNNVWRHRARRSHHQHGNSTFVFVDNEEQEEEQKMEQRVHADLCLGKKLFCST